eukprot:138490-Rhodomonas_salina.1
MERDILVANNTHSFLQTQGHCFSESATFGNLYVCTCHVTFVTRQQEKQTMQDNGFDRSSSIISVRN